MGKKILLFRSKTEETFAEDLYEKLLQSHGYHVRTISPIQFRFINQITLKNILETNKYDTLIFTSKRAIDAIQQVLTDNQRENLKKIYVEGPATGNLAREIFGPSVTILGETCGGSESLADFILNETKNSIHVIPMLFICAQGRLDVLPKRLSSASKIEFQEVVAYETISSTILEEELKNYLQNDGRPDILGFFSPSGFESVLKACERIGFDLNSKRPVLISLGKTTSAAIHGRLQSDSFDERMCRKPTADDFLNTVNTI